jgi:hypothetical protein
MIWVDINFSSLEKRISSPENESEKLVIGGDHRSPPQTRTGNMDLMQAYVGPVFDRQLGIAQNFHTRLCSLIMEVDKLVTAPGAALHIPVFTIQAPVT